MSFTIQGQIKLHCWIIFITTLYSQELQRWRLLYAIAQASSDRETKTQGLNIILILLFNLMQ